MAAPTQTPQTAGEMLELARAFLGRKDLPEARLEAELLVAHALDLDRLKLFLQLERPVDEEEVARARGLLMRRGKREPVAYLIGRREFYGRDFQVGLGCLIPRPETELMIDLARQRFGGPEKRGRWKPAARGEESPGGGEQASSGEAGAAPSTPAAEISRPFGSLRILDVGTGSGCLAVTLALELEGTHVTGIDLSAAALAFAYQNAEALAPDEAIEFLEGDALRLLRDRAEGARRDPSLRFELIVSNPPYVTPEEAPGLEPEVRDHEPGEALFAPKGDPDYWVRELLGLAERLLTPDGRLLIELGCEQGPRMSALLKQAKLDGQVHDDLEGLPRVLEVWL